MLVFLQCEKTKQAAGTAALQKIANGMAVDVRDEPGANVKPPCTLGVRYVAQAGVYARLGRMCFTI